MQGFLQTTAQEVASLDGADTLNGKHSKVLQQGCSRGVPGHLGVLALWRICANKRGEEVMREEMVRVGETRINPYQNS